MPHDAYHRFVRDGAGAGLPTTRITSRMRRDAALYEPAPPRTGRRGRPRTKGDRLPTPTGLAARTEDRDWTTVEINIRGHGMSRQAWTRDVLWYTVNTGGDDGCALRRLSTRSPWPRTSTTPRPPE